MKKILTIIFLCSISVYLFSQEVKVSEKQDLSILPMYSSRELPDFAWKYYDDRLVAVFASMKRFNIIGYQFRLDNNTVENFISKIQLLKKEDAYTDPKFIDKELGIPNLTVSDLEKLKNSFMIVIPTINGYDSKEYEVQIEVYEKGIKRIKIVPEWKVYISTAVKIMTAKGTLLSDVYVRETEATSRKSLMDAYQQAVNSALGGLELHLRSMDEFKLKTRVVKVEGANVMLELGANMGIKPGHEYFVEREENIEGFKENIKVGLIRVNNVRQNSSYATVIMGNPKKNDQLVEAPLAGLRTEPFIDIYLPGETPNIPVGEEQYFNNPIVIGLGIKAEKEIGYEWLFNTRLSLLLGKSITYHLNNIYGSSGYLFLPLLIEFGGGYEMYFGQLSIVGGANFGISTAYIYYALIDDYDVLISDIILKPNVCVSYLLEQKFKINVSAALNLDIPIQKKDGRQINPYLGGLSISAGAIFRF